MLVLRTGNLSVPRIQATVRGASPPDGAPEREQLEAWRAAGFRQVEDYVGWSAVEPVEDRWEWEHHRANAEAVRAAGLGYVAYAFAHALPPWFRASRRFVPSRCTQHGRAGPLPSLFAPSTWAAVERFHRALAENMHGLLDGLVIAFPADYGEVGYGSGMADWLLTPDPQAAHHHVGFWCDERPARREFAKSLRTRFAHDPGPLLERWGLDLMSVAQCPYPTVRATEEHWLDFARFYRGAVTDWTTRLLGLVAKLWPDVPRELKLGHGSEELALGADYGAIVRAAAAANTTVISTHSSLPELFTKRVRSLCRTHGARFATEAPREQSTEELASRVFIDAAHGSACYFEFPEQHAAVATRLERVRPAFASETRPAELALHYPELDLDLHPGLGLSEELALCHADLRGTADFDLADGRQIAAGSLRGVRGLIWLDGKAIRGAALRALGSWVRDGGVLVTGAAQAPRLVGRGDGDPELLALLAPSATRLPYVGAPAPGASGTRIEPGSPGHRIWLGRGWHGREQAGYAWPEVIAPIAARWSSPRATLLVPCPESTDDSGALRPLELRIDAHAPATTPVHVFVDGKELGAATLVGSDTLTFFVPGTESTLLRVELEVRPAPVPSDDERRDLGLLVRAVELHAAHAARSAGEVVPLAGHRMLGIDPLRAGQHARRLGAGWVLRGDGTPLSARAWLHTWLAGELAECPAPSVSRDARGRCHVTRLVHGLLIHNPDREEAHAIELVGAYAAPVEAPLEPLETRWLPVEP